MVQVCQNHSWLVFVWSKYFVQCRACMALIFGLWVVGFARWVLLNTSALDGLLVWWAKWFVLLICLLRWWEYPEHLTCLFARFTCGIPAICHVFCLNDHVHALCRSVLSKNKDDLWIWRRSKMPKYPFKYINNKNAMVFKQNRCKMVCENMD